MPKKSVKKTKKKKGLENFKFRPSSMGDVAADRLAAWAGSWTFIIGFVTSLIIWMGLNTVWIYYSKWDPYPFILLNLVLSCLAAIQAPIILMSQNRQANKDRQKFEYDYLVNRKAERGIEELHKKLDRIERQLNKKKK